MKSNLSRVVSAYCFNLGRPDMRKFDLAGSMNVSFLMVILRLHRVLFRYSVCTGAAGHESTPTVVNNNYCLVMP